MARRMSRQQQKAMWAKKGYSKSDFSMQYKTGGFKTFDELIKHAESKGLKTGEYASGYNDKQKFFYVTRKDIKTRTFEKK